MTTPANQVIANIRAATEALNAVLDCGQVEQTEDTITSQKLADALKYFYTLKTAYAELDEARKGIYKHLDTLNKSTIPTMLEDNDMADGVRIQVSDDIGYNFRVQTQYSAKQRDKEGLYNWLREQGDGELIQETVIPQAQDAGRGHRGTRGLRRINHLRYRRYDEIHSQVRRYSHAPRLCRGVTTRYKDTIPWHQPRRNRTSP